MWIHNIHIYGRRRITYGSIVNYRNKSDGDLNSEKRKRMHERCAGERKKTKGKMEEFELNTMSKK
jgi:hypothetical protein